MSVNVEDAKRTMPPKDSESRPETAPGEVTPRMRKGILWTGGGLLAIGATVLLAAEALIAPGGGSLPAWLWPIPLILGVGAIGFGFGVMVDESARQQQADVEAHDAFAEIHEEDDAINRESDGKWE